MKSFVRKLYFRLLPPEASAGSWRNRFCLAGNPVHTEVTCICIISNSITSISILRRISINITESARKTRIFRLALNTMTLQVTSVNVNSGQGVAISVTGIAQVNIGMTIGQS